MSEKAKQKRLKGNMYQLNVGVFGCGRMGKTRAMAASKLGATVSMVYDPDATRSAELAANYPGCLQVMDLETLNWHDLDAVFICTPPSERGKIELQAAAMRIPIFSEKPVGISATAASNLRNCIAKHAVITAVGYMNRYRKSVSAAREMISKGTVLGAAANWLCGKYQVPWWAQNQLSGGALNEQATHLVDLTRYLLGEIVEVTAFQQPNPQRDDFIEAASFLLKLQSGTICSCVYSCSAPQKMIDFEVFTTDGRVALNGWDFVLHVDDERRSEPIAHEDRNDVFIDETAAFFEAITTGSASTIQCSFEDAFQTQLVVDAIFRSLKSGKVESV